MWPNLVYTFTRTGVTSTQLTVNFTYAGSAILTTDYAASSADSPFTFAARSGTVTFAAGSSTIDPVADVIDENLALTLAPGTGYEAITPTAAPGTITDDGPPAFTINDVSVNEAAGTVTFTVDRNGATAFVTTVV